MKKVISIILVTILSYIGTNFVFAENNNDTLSVEVISYGKQYKRFIGK